MTKENLSQYSDSELSLRVFNDESLYYERHRSYFLGLLDTLFIYTPEQLAELEQDLLNDKQSDEEE